MRRVALLILGSMLVLPRSQAMAQVARCHGGEELIGIVATEIGKDTTMLQAKCGPRAAPVVIDLASDPNAERLSAAQLRAVEGRIANLQKVIVLLGKGGPEWERERDRVLEDMREDKSGLAFEVVNLVTIGLTKALTIVARSNLDGARVNALVKAFKEPLRDLPGEEARLQQIMATSKDPALTRAILEYTTALHRLQEARNTNDLATMTMRARDAVEALHEESEVMKLHPPDSHDVAGALYASSAIVGKLAMVFVAEGPEALAVLTGSVASSLAVGVGEMVRIRQEQNQLAALDQSASSRNRMSVELAGRLDVLQQQRERLVWAVQHARSGRAME